MRNYFHGMSFRFMALVASAWLVAFSSAMAFDSAEVLPRHLHSPAMRMGIVTGIEQRYVSDGTLMTLDDFHSINFDSQALTRIEPKIQELVKVLDQYGGHELGSALNLGTLHVHTEPQIQYLAPLHAYGITDRWTVAVGVPIAFYTNRMSLTESGSNVQTVRSLVKGSVAQVDAAFDRLNVSLVDSAKELLNAKGYKPIGDRKQTIVGDVQAASLFQFYKRGPWTLTSKSLLTLPTGPGNDPDDIADLGLFGHTSLEQFLIANLRASRRWRLSTKVSYNYEFAQRVTKRVPTSESDDLPGPETRETVVEKRGDTISGTAGVQVMINETLSARTAYEVMQKSSDEYSGDRKSRYSLLARDSFATAQRVHFGGSYDSTAAYRAKRAAIPAIIAYEFSDTVNGQNIERQSIHELWVTMFF